MSATSTPSASAHCRPRTSRRRRIVLWTIAGGLLLVVLAVAWFAYDAREARSALNRVADRIPAAQQAADAGDLDGALAIMTTIAPDASAARAHTSGPLWGLASHVPVVGEDVRAVRAAAAAVDDLSRKVTPALASVADTMSGKGLSISSGRVDVTALSAAAPQLAAADATVRAVDRRLADVDVSRLHTEIAEPYTKLVAGTTELRSLAGTANRVATLAPAMLGEDGARRYLIVAMNSAELRSGGGIPGAFAEVTADRGTIGPARHAATSDVGPFDQAVAALSAGEIALYTDRPARYVQDVTMIPDFPRAATLTQAMWKSATGTVVDGVIATDPVALSYLLEATGPVTVEGVALTSENAVQVLLSDSYSRLPDDRTDAFFAAVATKVLSQLLAGGTDPQKLIEALDRAASEHRILVWSAEETEEKILADTVVSGAIDTAPAAASSIGVFLNDATGAKMDYYLASDVTLTGSQCAADGRVDTVEVPLGSNAPADAADALPWYVTGGGLSGIAPGLTATQVVLYPPRAGTVTNVMVDGKSVVARQGKVSGRAALAFPVTLEPGQRATVTFSVTTPSARPAGATSSVDIWSTPTTTSPGLRTFPVASCS